jgi:hypothetical protein
MDLTSDNRRQIRIALQVAGTAAFAYVGWRGLRSLLRSREHTRQDRLYNADGLAPGLSRDRSFGGGACDAVEEASINSFPASDAPSWH